MKNTAPHLKRALEAMCVVEFVFASSRPLYGVNGKRPFRCANQQAVRSYGHVHHILSALLCVASVFQRACFERRRTALTARCLDPHEVMLASPIFGYKPSRCVQFCQNLASFLFCFFCFSSFSFGAFLC